MNELTLSTALETALNRIEDMLSDDDGQAFKEARKFLPVGRAALAAQPGAVGERKHIPIEPTDEMLNEGAQRLVSWGEDSKWPDSWSKLQVKAAKNEAERVWRSMWLAAPTEAKPAQQDAVDAELEPYDAGLLGDFGGGNVEWWQDYIRAELGRAHDFYQTQCAAISAKKGGAA